MRTILKSLQRAARQFLRSDALVFAAAVAFYTSLSLAPLIVLTLWATDMLGPGVQQGVVEETKELLGTQASETVQTVVDHSEDAPKGGLAGIFGLATLLAAATGVFVQLQKAMNRVWNVEAAPGGGVWRFVRKRALSLGMIAVIGFLLLVSLILSSGLNAVAAHAQEAIPGSAALWLVLDHAVALGVYVLLFAAIFKLLPDVRIAWRDVWFGAAVTAVLFATGKLLLGLYLGRSGLGSAYGAAGSVVLLLVWVYYSSVLLFFGAEVTQAWAALHDRQLVPDRHARLHTPSARPAHTEP